MLTPEEVAHQEKVLHAVKSSDVVQVVMHGAMWPQFLEWLGPKGFILHQLPSSVEEDAADLQTWGIAFGHARAQMLKDL